MEELLLELLAMPDVTGQEDPIASWVSQRYHGLEEQVRRIGHSVVIGAVEDDRPTVLLVGHLDVVPPTEADFPPTRRDDRIVGRGSSDMKSGLAVAMDCFEDPALRAGPYNLVLVCYAGEEGPHEANELSTVLREIPELSRAQLAVVLEPTDLSVQLGCMGGLHAQVVFGGRAAHSARPWHGDNALTKAASLLEALHDRSPRDVEVDGLVYREVIVPTQAWTGSGAPTGARNVVPDRFSVNVNYRFAPGKDAEAATGELTDLIGEVTSGQGEVTIVDVAPAGPTHRRAPLVEAFTEAVGAPVEAKQAWTDVARLAGAGIPALNYGPGLAEQAHQAGEYVLVDNLDRARDRLARFLERPPSRRDRPA